EDASNRVPLAGRATTPAHEDAHGTDGETDVDEGLTELDQPPTEPRGIVAVAAAVEERLRQPPDRVRGEAAREEDEQRARPAVGSEDTESALRVGRLPARAEGQLNREHCDDREADA